MKPSSETAKRVAAIMHRKPSTHWAKNEVRRFRELLKVHGFDDLESMERYYASNWPPRHGKNSLRTDLYTLLNHWPGELDRANIWAERNPVKTVRKVIPVAFVQSEPYAEQAGDAESVQRFNQEREARGRESAFAKVKREMQG